MKIYVDGELPKECFDCPCFRNDIEMCCGLDDGTKDYHNFVEDSNCPLETTQSLKQQVREEVVEEIKKFANSIFTRYEKRELDDVAYGEILCCNVLIKKLGCVKRENNVQD